LEWAHDDTNSDPQNKAENEQEPKEYAEENPANDHSDSESITSPQHHLDDLNSSGEDQD